MFRASGLGFRGLGCLGFRVWDLGTMVQGLNGALLQGSQGQIGTYRVWGCLLFLERKCRNRTQNVCEFITGDLYEP